MRVKSQSDRPGISEMPPYRLGRHWNMIQAYLIPGIEDNIGKLSEEMKKFMGICELLIDEDRAEDALVAVALGPCHAYLAVRDEVVEELPRGVSECCFFSGASIP